MELENIKITHFINPHKFWFRIHAIDKQFLEFDINLQQYFIDNRTLTHEFCCDQITTAPYEPNEVVAYFEVNWQKWLRGRIANKPLPHDSDNSKIDLFLLDFGYPILADTKFMQKIPSDFQLWANENIKYGAINQILPGVAVFNIAVNDIQINIADNWSDHAIRTAKQMISDNTNVCFTGEFELNGQWFGKLFILSQACTKLEISSILIKLQQAVFVENITDKVEQTIAGSPILNSSFHFSRCETPNSGIDTFYKEVELNKISSTKSLNLLKPELVEIQSSSLTKQYNSIDLPVNSKISLVEENYGESDGSTVPEVITESQRSRTESISVKSEDQNVSKIAPSLAITSFKCDSSDKIENGKVCNELDSNKSEIEVQVKSPTLIELHRFETEEIVICENKLSTKTEIVNLVTEELVTYDSSNSVLDTICNDSEKDKIESNHLNIKIPINQTETMPTNSDINVQKPLRLDNSNSKVNSSVEDVSVSSNYNQLIESNSDTESLMSSPHLEKIFNKIRSIKKSAEAKYKKDSKNLQSPEELENQANTSSFSCVSGSLSSTFDISINDSAAGHSDDPNAIRNNNSISADDELSTTNSGIKTYSNHKPAKKVAHKTFTKKHSDLGNSSVDVSNSDTAITNFSYKSAIPDFRLNNGLTAYENIKQERNKKCTFLEKEHKHIVLVHGYSAVKPVESMEQVNFSKDVHHALDQIAIKRLFRIDSYTWPHLLKGTSFVVIGAEKTGKTISYLPALINLILINEEDEYIVDGTGPVALIVAATSEQVCDIYHVCKQINRHLKSKLSIVKGHGIHNDKLAMDLLSGVHILVTTPGCLDRMLNSNIPLVNTLRLKHFVIDDFHLMTHQIDLIKNIIKSCCILNAQTESYEQQIIITSVYWHKTFMGMLKKTNNSFVCFGSYMESTYYASQAIKLLFIAMDQKLIKLAELVSDRAYRIHHTLIVCREDTEVELIVKYLQDLNLEVIGCSRLRACAMSIRSINDWNDRNSCSLNIVVCTDDILPELHLNRVKILIHYSLSATWSKFQYRYSTFFASLPNILINEELETKSIILIDETNNSELPRFIDFLKIHGTKIMPVIEEVANQIRNEKEMSKVIKHMEFCKNILKFGLCRKHNICKYRHVFSDEQDKPTIPFPVKKYIKFKRAYVHSPAHFAIQILGTRETMNDNWTEFDRESFKIFNIKFKQFYAVKRNHMQHTSCAKGELCTLNIREKFCRCKILDVEEKRGVLSVRRVIVKAIDNGEIHNTTESRLLYLPDEFKLVPPKLADVRLGGIVPVDHEPKWDNESTSFVQKYLDKYEKHSKLFIEASISFIIADTIFVDAIVYKQDLGKHGGGEIIDHNFKFDVVKNKFGVSDGKSFICAKEVVRSAGFHVFEESKLHMECTSAQAVKINNQIPEDKKSTESDSVIEIKKNDKSNITASSNESFKSSTPNGIIDKKDMSDSVENRKITKSHKNVSVILPSTIECVHLCNFSSPSLFFVQKMSSKTVLFERFTEIQEYIAESNKKPLTNFAIGDMCLVFYDGCYDRAKILSILDDRVLVQIYDFGFVIEYQESELYEIDDVFRQQPCEAISCKLFGILPATTIESNQTVKWDEKCIDDIYDYVNDNYTKLYVKKIMEGNGTFNVIMCGMLDESKPLDIINKLLVEKGWAKYDEEVKSVFDRACEMLSAEFEENFSNKSVVLHRNNDVGFNEEELDINFSDDDYAEMFNLPKSSIIDKPMHNMLPSATITEINDDVTADDDSSPKEIKENNLPIDIVPIARDYGYNPPPLVSCFNLLPLETIWHQDPYTVTLKINVTDHVDYCIEVHRRLLYVCVQFEDRSSREICLNLFGAVNLKEFYYAIVGNYLRIVLMKTIRMNLLWPRLLLVDSKSSWLKYNFDTFKDVPLDEDYIRYVIKRADDSSSGSEDDDNFEEDDECDPLSSQYNFTENKFFDENNIKG